MYRMTVATMKRNFRIAKRAFPWSFFVARVLMGIYIAVFSYFTFHYMFEGNLDDRFKGYTGSTDYMTFAIVGAGVYVLAVATIMNVGRSLMIEMWEGTLENLLLSPASRRGYFVGNFIEQLGRSLLELLAICLTGWLLGAKFQAIHVVDLVLIAIVTLISFFSMGVMIATLMLYLRDTFITQNTLFITMSLLCGISFPVQYLPFWLQPFSHLFPLTASLQLFRSSVLSGETSGNNLPLIGEISVLSVVYLVVGFWLLRKNERRIIENTFA